MKSKKKIYIVANWKMNPQNLAEAKRLFDAVAQKIKNSVNLEVVMCPPFLYLPHLKNENLKTGGQNCFYEDSGAFTGEISAVMLKNMNCEYVILGHSERRKYQQETDEIVNKKTESALKAGLKPIVCIDNLSQFENLKSIENLIIAYEPLECIGNGKACDPKDAEKMRISIEKEVGKDIPVLYGGSVNAQNAKNYIETAGFSGLLIGGVSLRVDEFAKIVDITGSIGI